jgi:hypothetical protein
MRQGAKSCEETKRDTGACASEVTVLSLDLVLRRDSISDFVLTALSETLAHASFLSFLIRKIQTIQKMRITFISV